MNKKPKHFDAIEQKAIDAIEAAFGHKFENPMRVIKALTHASLGGQSNHVGDDYERLEFLGDRVVNLIVADLLLKKFPLEKEGDLARRHTAFVRSEALARAARNIGVPEHLRLSVAEKGAGGAENDNILADSMEALIAALYLDAGYGYVYDYVETVLGEEISDMKAPPVDPKTGLQEWTQARKMGLPIYKMEDRIGPDHAPEFLVSVIVRDQKGKEIERATGKGASKRTAEKEAAQAMMALLLSPVTKE